MADSSLTIQIKTEPAEPLEKLVKQAKDAEKEVSGLGASFAKLGAVGAALASLAFLKGTFDFVVGATREFEDLTTQLQGLTGSAESAASQLEELNGIPGPSLPELVAADKALLSFGVSSNKTIDQLKSLNDIAIGSGAKIADLAEIFGKVQEQGTLTGETFNKLSKQIPGFASTFAAALGVPRASFKALAEEGKISSDQVVLALSKITSQGGKYFDEANKKSKTLSGALDELGDSATALGASIGTSAVPGLSSLINFTTKAIESSRSYVLELKKIANENESEKRIRSIGSEIVGLTEKLETFKAKQKEKFGFFSDDPFKVATEIDALTSSILKLGLERKNLLDSEGAASTAKKDAESFAEAEKIKLKALDDAAAKRKEINDATLAEKLKATQDQENKLKESEKRITEITFLEAAVRQEILKEQEGVADEEKLARLQEREAELTSERLKIEADRFQQLGQFTEAELTRDQDRVNKKAEIERLASAKKLEEQKKSNANKSAIDIKADADYQAFLDSSFQQRVNKTRTGLAALASLQRSGSREGFEIGKAAAKAQVLIDIPKAAFAAYTSLIGTPFIGPVIAPLAAAAAVLAGQQQLAQIDRQSFGLAEGGIVPGVGNLDTVPALLTPGELVVPKSNFEDLQNNLSTSVNADQIVLLQQGNEIQGKILEVLAFGAVADKLTQIIAGLDALKTSIGSISNGSSGFDSRNTPAEPPQTTNEPIPISRSIGKKRDKEFQRRDELA